MAMVEPTGASNPVFTTPTAKVETDTQAASETDRPVEEAEQTQQSDNRATSQATESDSTLGRFVDTSA